MNESLIQPWQVYLVMQMDSFKVMFGVISGLFLGITVLLFLWGGLKKDTYYRDDEAVRVGNKLQFASIKTCVAAAVMLVLTTAIPSTKTVAAMLILPALTSQQVVDPVLKEGGELYKLAKKALETKLKDDSEPPQVEQPAQ